MTGKMKAAPAPSLALAAALMLGVSAAPAAAQQPDGATDKQSMQAQLDHLKAELAAMKRQQREKDNRDDQRFKRMKRGVIRDADTRDSLGPGVFNAGVNKEGKLFLRSPDSAFEFNLGGYIQTRYIYNHRDDTDNATPIDNDVSGFQLRRLKVEGSGHIGDPGLGYKFVFAGSRNGGVKFEEYHLFYKFGKGFKIDVGRLKAPFARENLTSASRQMAVDRSVVWNIFKVDFTEGAILGWKNDTARLRFAVDNGIGGSGANFQNNAVDYAFTGRADLKLAGDWKKEAEFTSWPGEDLSAFLGVAGHYQQGESGAQGTAIGTPGDTLLLSADGSAQTHGFSTYYAAYYRNANSETDRTFNDFGVEGQVAYNINGKIEPFLRYEMIGFDHDRGFADNNVNVITAGFNWYQHKHNAKFTADIVYIPNSLGAGASDGLGLLPEGGDGQFALRAQYQLKF